MATPTLSGVYEKDDARLKLFCIVILILQFAVSVELDSECHRASATLVCHTFVFDFFKGDGAASRCRRAISDVF